MKQIEKQEIEKEIVASLIADYDGLIDYLTIPVNEFSYKYAEIIKVMKEIWTWDPTLVSNKTKWIWIDDLYEISLSVMHTNPSEFQVYVDTLRDIIQRERIVQALRNSICNVEWYGSLWEIYLSIHNEFLKVDEFNEDDNNLEWVLNDLMDEVSWNKKVKIIPTWYRDLDELIWWFEPWQIIVIWARPWIWKSMVAINLMANNMSLWEKVALFSLEMPNKQNLRRMLSMNTWISVGRLKSWDLTKDEMEVAMEWKKKIQEQSSNFELIDNVSTIWELESKIRYLVHKKGISIFYIDYLQLLKSPWIDNPVECITDISQRLKQLAIQMKITIVELSQMNRESDKSAVKRASQLRGSGSIEQDADMVFILDKDDETDTRIQVSVQKCRDGRLWDIELFQNSATMQIINKPLSSKPF